ncbi:MAG: hypothetical protein ABI969_08300 [bacterium]
MALDFTRTNVVPGEPVTAQAWNAIVDGLFEVQAILATGSGTVRVAVTGDQRDIDAARVVATDAAGVRYEAVQQLAPGDPFVFPKLTAGAYTITVSAPACTNGTGSVTIANDGTATPNPVPIALAFAGARMPNVLGAKWKDAAAIVAPVNPRVLDAAGKGVPLIGFDPGYADLPVLMQWPDPDEIIPAAKNPFVIVAAVIKAAVLVPTPNFIGLTVAQAQVEAAKSGLLIKVV